MTMIDCRPFLAVGVPFLAAILIAFSRRWPNIRETWSVIASVIMFGIVIIQNVRLFKFARQMPK